MHDESHPLINQQEHTRLLQALRESELLRELSELLASSLDPTHILQVLVRRTTEVCDVERCAVWLLNEEQTTFSPSAYHVSTQHFQGKIVQIADRMWRQSFLPFDNPLIERLFAEGMLFLENLNAEPSMHFLAEKFFVGSILLVALIREGRPVGMMSLDHPNRFKTFTREQQQLARTIGQQAAVAIDNARLYQEARYERERAQRLIERSQSIYQVAMNVNSGADLSDILTSAAQHLVRGASGERAMITLLDPTGRTFDKSFCASSTAVSFPPISRLHSESPSPSSSDFIPQLQNMPYAQKAAISGELLFVSQKQLSGIEKQWFDRHQFKNILIVPLIIGLTGYLKALAEPEQPEISSSMAQKTSSLQQNCIGLAFVSYEQASPIPTPGKYTFARDIAAQCALAVEKARIFSKAQQALQLATERANTLDAVFNAMTEGILVVDMEGQAILKNSTASDFVDTSSSDIVAYLKQQPIYTLYGQRPIAPQDYPLLRALRGERIRGERFLSSAYGHQERAIEINSAPLYNSNDQQIGIVSAFRDITEQVRAEQRIRHALDTMLHAVEAVSDITNIQEILHRVLAMTLAALNCEHGVIQLYDEEAQTFSFLLSLGFSSQETEKWQQETTFWNSLNQHPDATIYSQLLEGRATLLDIEPYSHTAPDLPRRVLAAPIMYNTRLLGVMLLERTPFSSNNDLTQQRSLNTSLQTALMFSAWDIAIIEGIGQFTGLAIEQKRWKQEAEIARSNEATMRESNALKDEFLAITAHEFRTPLTIILTNSQLMARQLQRTPRVPVKLQERFKESIAFIEEQTRQLTNIVNTFLEVTRLNRGQIVIAQEELSLEEIIQEVIDQHTPTLTQHDIRYRVEPGSSPYILKGDKARLSQIFANLLQNAIKYSPLGGPITITLQQYLSPKQEPLIKVCVEDKGIGVPKEAQPHLFERFYRAPNIGGSQTRGVGLGLYLVAEFLSLHSGTICVESDGIVGKGSRFILTLPLYVPINNC